MYLFWCHAERSVEANTQDRNSEVSKSMEKHPEPHSTLAIRVCAICFLNNLSLVLQVRTLEFNGA